jgi:glycerol-3-phosphate O-acyltransferase
MAAEHRRRAMRAWGSFGRWLSRAYEMRIDATGQERLRELDRDRALIWLPSHRSYLDAWLLPLALDRCGLSPMYTMGGANLDFWPFGTVARRAGWVFIRRSIRDDPVYRLALRRYVAELVRRRANLGWAIEGGRTRTGKLRPPAYGLLRYVADAVRDEDRDDAVLVPVSIVYDQLHETALIAAESRGASKRQEGLAWLVTYGRQQRRRLGCAYVHFGEPLELRARLAELEAEPHGCEHAVHRVALEVCHRINRVTPITPTAMVTLALLAAGRALSLDGVTTTLLPSVAYLERRGYPVAGAADLRARGAVRRALDDLVASGVVMRFDGGTEPVWCIGAEQHLIAAFYRNTAIHFLVNRAIAELVVQRVIEEQPEDLDDFAWQEALRLRDLLKFEFFFARKRDFAEEMRAELELLQPGWERQLGEPVAGRRDRLRSALAEARPLVAHLVLRPFLEAYLVLAERLATHAAVERDRLLQECLGVARQWELEGRLHSAESVSLELLGTAWRLVDHRGLTQDVAHRQAFADELRDTVRRIGEIEALARAGATA